MTKTNASNVGIAHLGRKAGGEPVCRKRGAYVVVPRAEFKEGFWTPCKRCQAILARREAWPSAENQSGDER